MRPINPMRICEPTKRPHSGQQVAEELLQREGEHDGADAHGPLRVCQDRFSRCSTTTEPQTSDRAMRKMSSSSFGARHLLVDIRPIRATWTTRRPQVKGRSAAKPSRAVVQPSRQRPFGHRAPDQPDARPRAEANRPLAEDHPYELTV